MPYNKKSGAAVRMYDSKGKPAGLMLEGSLAHMESALYHSGKSKLHVKPGKDYPDDGHLHYQDGKKVESPGVSETKKLSDTPLNMPGNNPEHAKNPAKNDGHLHYDRTTNTPRKTPYKMHGDPDTPHPDPKKKATTTLSNALASDKDYEVVPGFEERLGGELEGVVVTAPATTNATNNNQTNRERRKAKRRKKRNTYSKTGIAIQTLGTYLPGGGGKYRRRQLENTGREGLF